MGQVERIGISLDKELLGMFDSLINRQGYPNRSEAIRDLIRDRLAMEAQGKPSAMAVAGVFLVYNHHSSILTQKRAAPISN